MWNVWKRDWLTAQRTVINGENPSNQAMFRKKRLVLLETVVLLLFLLLKLLYTYANHQEPTIPQPTFTFACSKMLLKILLSLRHVLFNIV